MGMSSLDLTLLSHKKHARNKSRDIEDTAQLCPPPPKKMLASCSAWDGSLIIQSLTLIYQICLYCKVDTSRRTSALPLHMPSNEPGVALPILQLPNIAFARPGEPASFEDDEQEDDLRSHEASARAAFTAAKLIEGAERSVLQLTETTAERCGLSRKTLQKCMHAVSAASLRLHDRRLTEVLQYLRRSP